MLVLQASGSIIAIQVSANPDEEAYACFEKGATASTFSNGASGTTPCTKQWSTITEMQRLEQERMKKPRCYGCTRRWWPGHRAHTAQRRQGKHPHPHRGTAPKANTTPTPTPTPTPWHRRQRQTPTPHPHPHPHRDTAAKGKHAHPHRGTAAKGKHAHPHRGTAAKGKHPHRGTAAKGQ